MQELEGMNSRLLARIALLEAPKEAVTEIADHLIPEQNGQDKVAQTVQTVSKMPEEQPKAERWSEVISYNLGLGEGKSSRQPKRSQERSGAPLAARQARRVPKSGPSRQARCASGCAAPTTPLEIRPNWPTNGPARPCLTVSRP